MTVANELPLWPTVDVGFSVIDAGGGCGVSVTCAWTVRPFQLAVTVAVVLAVTVFVCSGNDVDMLPGLTKIDGGGLTAGESLERATVAPPRGA